MSYRIEQPLAAWRRIDFPSVAGFLLASAGLVALIVEVNVRGWLGFAGSGADFAVVTVWLTLAGALSAWAFQRADGWWPLLAAAGVLLSVVAVAVLFVVAVIWLLVNFPSLLTGDSKRGGKGRRRRRR